jgi:hypothetical protein
MKIVKDDSRVINKLETPLTDDARVVIYDRHMFIIPDTGVVGLASSICTFKKLNERASLLQGVDDISGREY